MSDTLRGDKVTTSTAEELKRLWEWSENIREEVGALSDAIAKLAAEDLPDEGGDEEATSNDSNDRQRAPLGVRC